MNEAKKEHRETRVVVQEEEIIVFIDGDDVSLISTGIMTSKAIKAAKILSEKGISAQVINMSSIKPLDKKAIKHAAKETNGGDVGKNLQRMFVS